MDGKALYRRWLLDLWNGDLDAADDIVTPGFLVHQARIDRADSEAARGPDNVRDLVRQAHAPFQTITFEIAVGPLQDGDLVAGRWVGHGTYAGGIPGATAPAGTEVEIAGTDILRLDGDRFAEYWVSSDGLELMAQLGAM
jgi:predicted ester cyclase